MKIFMLFAVPCAALAVVQNSGSKDLEVVASSESAEDLAACVSYVENFLKGSTKRDKAISKAMDHCALDKKVDDANFVCPHFREILTEAFRREPTTREYTAKSFCDVAEQYVSELSNAHKVPNMGKGAGFTFKLAKSCKSTVLASFSDGEKTLPTKQVPDFWYALCMNQDCAHFLPSRTRWCTHDHAPTHAQSVCEAVRTFAHDSIFITRMKLFLKQKSMNADEVCNIYDEFVEETHINTAAYKHVVYGTKEHPVPSPANQKRALESAAMKNEAGKNKIADSAGEPVKNAAVGQTPLLALLSLAGFWMYHM